MTGLAARGIPLGAARAGIELTVLVAGWLLGGSVGVATVAFALAIGPLVHRALPWLRSGKRLEEDGVERRLRAFTRTPVTALLAADARRRHARLPRAAAHRGGARARARRPTGRSSRCAPRACAAATGTAGWATTTRSPSPTCPGTSSPGVVAAVGTGGPRRDTGRPGDRPVLLRLRRLRAVPAGPHPGLRARLPARLHRLGLVRRARAGPGRRPQLRAAARRARLRGGRRARLPLHDRVRRRRRARRRPRPATGSRSTAAAASASRR